jgi:hypothetical protein
MGVVERAEAAGTYVAARERALQNDPEITAIRSTAGTVGASALLRREQRLHDHELEALVFDPKDADDRPVERMVNAAAASDSYRVQLLDLAALHGGLFERAVDALYLHEARSLGRWEALARHRLDRRQLIETRAQDGGGEDHPSEGDRDT